MPESSFSEVISVSCDLSQMRAAFQEMESAYSAMLARLSKMAVGTPLAPSGNGSQTQKQTQAERELQRVRETSNRALARYLSLSDEQQRKIAGQTTALNTFWSKLTSNVGGSAGVVMRYTSEVLLFLGALRMARQAVADVVGAFREGINHLATLQTRSTDIKEALLENVVYSKDFAENILLAGQNARYVTEQIEEMAPKLGLAPERLEQTFKSLAQGGGLRLVNGDLGQAVTLAAQFMSVMRSRGIEQQRRSIKEVNDLMSGNVKQASALLQVLGYTPAQWQKIRQEALAHGNLVALISDRLSAVNERLATAGTRWDSVVASVREYREHFLGAMSEALFATLLSYLQQIKSYFETHQTQLLNMARLLGEAVAKMLAFGTEVRDAQNPVIAIMTAFGKMAVYLEGALDTTKILFSYLGKLGASAEEEAANKKAWAAEMELNNARTVGDKAAEKSAQDRLDIAQKEAELARQKNEMETSMLRGQYTLRQEDRAARIEELDEARAAFGRPFYGPQLAPAQPAPPIGYVNKPEVGTDAKSQLAAAKEGYRNALQQKKQALQERQNLLEEDHARNLLSQQEFSDRMVAELEAARFKVDALAKEYLKKVSGMGGLTEEQRSNLTSAISELQAKEDTAISREVSKQKQSAYKDEEDRKLAALRRELEAAKAYAQSEIQLARLVGVSETEIVDREVAAREDAFQRETAILNQELIAAKQNAAERERIIGQLTLLTQNNAEQVAQDQARRRQAEFADFQAEQQHRRDLIQLQAQAEEESIRHKAAVAANPYATVAAEKQILELRIQLAEATKKLADAELARAQAAHLAQSEIDRAQANVAAAQAGVATAKNAQSESEVVTRRNQGNIFQVLFGDAVTSLGDFTRNLQNANTALPMFANMLQALPGIIQAVKSGYESGGTLGAIGAGMQTVGAFIPGPIGAGIQIGGQVLSMIGSLFGNAAKKIAEQIRKDMEETITAYNNHTASLIDTMHSLEKERAEAISRLSGAKGGGSELSKLLKDIDSQLAQLNEQRLEIMSQFDLGYRQLELWSQGRSQAVVDIITASRTMFKQIGDYIGAGGSATQALQYLQWSMQQQKANAAKEYRDLENQAIQDAQTLNDLLKQRVNLQNEYKQNQYELLSKDSLERRTSNAVTIGRQIQQLTAKYKDDLDNLKSQIDLQQQKVTLEQQAFHLQTDSASLAAKSAANAIAALKEQINLASDYASIIKGAYDYLWNWDFIKKWNPVSMGSIPTPQIAGGNTYSNVTIAPGAITVVAPAGANGTTIGQQIGNELARQFRYGYRPSYAR